MQTRMLGIAVALSCLGSQAEAATVLYSKFYSGPGTGPAYTGPYGGTGTVYSNTATSACTGTCFSGTNTLKPAGDPNSTTSDFQTGAGVTQTFSSNGLTIGATANTGNGVWNDLSPNFGGLGTGLPGQSSNLDQIAGSETLTLSFSSQVQLDGVGTLFDAPHLTFGTNFTTEAQVTAAAPTMKFDISVNGGAFTAYSLLLANTLALGCSPSAPLCLTGTTFTFREDQAKDANGNFINPELYISAVAYQQNSGTTGQGTTPLPAALPLFASGLGALGLFGWRRKRKASAIAA